MKITATISLIKPMAEASTFLNKQDPGNSKPSEATSGQGLAEGLRMPADG